MQQRAPSGRCGCTQQIAALFCVKWRHGRHLKCIRNPTPSIDAYLLEDKFCQTLLRSDLKRRSLIFFEDGQNNNKNKNKIVKVKVKECASYLWKSISQLRSVTCHMGSDSVTFQPTQANTPRLYPSPTGWYSIYRPFKDGGLSKPRPRVQRATGPRLLRVVVMWDHFLI